ncbi:MAG TPA: hypothetical protein VFG30_01545 [Polyangiales bacterium]|nr:hypothetical protein [Polyangiales bacterium]
MSLGKIGSSKHAMRPIVYTPVCFNPRTSPSCQSVLEAPQRRAPLYPPPSAAEAELARPAELVDPQLMAAA